MINEIELTKLGERVFHPSECLKALRSNVMYYHCWGVKKIFGIGTESDGWVKGVLLKVNGAKWKEYVLVTLNWADYYQVRLINKKGEIKEIEDDIFCEDLNKVVDKMVESN
jgi:hypothetical protein